MTHYLIFTLRLFLSFLLIILWKFAVFATHLHVLYHLAILLFISFGVPLVSPFSACHACLCMEYRLHATAILWTLAQVSRVLLASAAVSFVINVVSLCSVALLLILDDVPVLRLQILNVNVAFSRRIAALLARNTPAFLLAYSRSLRSALLNISP